MHHLLVVFVEVYFLVEYKAILVCHLFKCVEWDEVLRHVFHLLV